MGYPERGFGSMCCYYDTSSTAGSWCSSPVLLGDQHQKYQRRMPRITIGHWSYQRVVFRKGWPRPSRERWRPSAGGSNRWRWGVCWGNPAGRRHCRCTVSVLRRRWCWINKWVAIIKYNQITIVKKSSARRNFYRYEWINILAPVK